MLIIPLLLWLACPPTATPDRVPEDVPGIATPQHGVFLVPPYGDHFDDERGSVDWASIPAASHDSTDLPTLPLWDLDATLAVLDAEHGKQSGPQEVIWLRWAIASAQRRPATAQSWLVAALASDQLTAGQLAWWRAIAPLDRHDQDALLVAYGRATEVQTRLYLASALALGEWALSCPVGVALDGACRMPGTNQPVEREASPHAGRRPGTGGFHGREDSFGQHFLVRREPIAVARARHWTKLAHGLRRKLANDPADVAALALLAELDLAAMTEDYEAQLVARMPSDLDFLVEEYLHGSGVPAWEQRYEHQQTHVAESRARFDAFQVSSLECGQSLYDRHLELVRVEAKLAARIHLREAILLRSMADSIERVETLSDREWLRERVENPDRWSYGHGSDAFDLLHDRIDDLLARCIDPTFTVDLDVIEACRALLDASDPVEEFVPSPQASSTMQRHGVVAPSEL